MDPVPRHPDDEFALVETLVAQGSLRREALEEGRVAWRSAREQGRTATLAEFLLDRGLVTPSALDAAAARPVEFGRYRDLREIGRGGMGVVYRALDPELGRSVAIKVLRLPASGSELAAARFCREARITGQIEHPNVVPVHEVARTPHGVPYMVMKLVEGRSLAERLAEVRARPPQERLGLRRRLLADFLKVCDAVAYAHSRGVVHRDLKPANVMIGAFGEVQVMDWGLAKVLGSAESTVDAVPAGAAPGETLDGALIGTPGYMPPEQADTLEGAIDERSDVYSLGAILYEIATLTPPLRGTEAVIALKELLLGELEPPSRRAPDAKIPHDLEAAILRAMARSPAKRYPDVASLQSDVARWLEGHPLSAARYTAAERAAKWVGRHRATSAVAALALVALAASSGLFLESRRRQAERNAREAFALKAESDDHAREADAMRLEAERRERRAVANYGQALAEKGFAALDRAAVGPAAIYLTRALEIAEEPRRRGGAIQAIQRAWRPRIVENRSEGHATIAWCPRGERLAVTGEDGSLRVWDWAAGAPSSRLEPAPGPIALAEWSPDGTRLAAGSVDGVLRFWEPETGNVVVARCLASSRVTAIAWSPGGERLAVSWWDGSVSIFDTASGKWLASGTGGGTPVLAVAWSPDGASIAGGDVAGVLHVWDARTGSTRATLPGHEDAIVAVAWAPGARPATASFDRRAIVWDVESKSPAAVLSGHAGPVMALAWSPGGRRLATASWDHTAALWDPSTGALVASLPGHPGRVLCLAWAPSGNRIASGSEGGGLRVWDCPTGRAVAVLDHAGHTVRQVAWSASGRRLASSVIDGSVAVWEAPEFPALLEDHGDAIDTVDWSGDGRLASAGRDRRLIVWDDATGRAALAWAGWGWRIDWAPDGDAIAAAGSDGGLVVIDAADATERWRAPADHEDNVWWTGWSPDRRTLASAGADRTVRLWTPGAGDRPFVLREHDAPVFAGAWSPDGRTLASGSDDGVLVLLDVPARRVRARLRAHGARIAALDWSPAGDRFASASLDRRVAIRDATTGEPGAWIEDAAPITDVRWSPDGAYLASTTGDGRLRIHDAATGRTLAVAGGSGRAATALAWSPDSRRLAVAYEDARLRIWDLALLLTDTEGLSRLAAERTGFVLEGLSVR